MRRWNNSEGALIKMSKVLLFSRRLHLQEIATYDGGSIRDELGYHLRVSKRKLSNLYENPN